jgi:hypothetical protein
MVNHATYINKRTFLPFPLHGFPTLCVVVFIVVSDLEMRGGFLDIDGIVDHHDLTTFFS